MGKMIKCTDGTIFERVSRGISLRADYDITPRHELYDHREETGGVSYIKYKALRIPTDSMIALGSAWDNEKPHVFIENGVRRIISACDWYNSLYNSYYIEYREDTEKFYLYLKH